MHTGDVVCFLGDPKCKQFVRLNRTMTSHHATKMFKFVGEIWVSARMESKSEDFET